MPSLRYDDLDGLPRETVLIELGLAGTMRVYHFSKRKHGLAAVRERRLKVATINDLNDPFELLAITSLDAGERKALGLTKAQLAREFGMLCFSSDWKNPVQWSHYAAGHRGVCLGFDVPDGLLTTVSYRRKRLPLDKEALAARDESSKALMTQLLSTKYSHWKYENERRSFVTLEEKDAETGLYFMPFSEKLELKEVIVGHRATISRAELTEALGDASSQVVTFKARLAFKSFSVARQKDQQLWK